MFISRPPENTTPPPPVNAHHKTAFQVTAICNVIFQFKGKNERKYTTMFICSFIKCTLETKL